MSETTTASEHVDPDDDLAVHDPILPDLDEDEGADVVPPERE